MAEHDAVLEAAVVAYGEPTELYTLKAFVVLREGMTPTPELAEELKDFIKQRISPYKHPWHVQFMDALPKSATGKLLRYRLRELATNSSNL